MVEKLYLVLLLFCEKLSNTWFKVASIFSMTWLPLLSLRCILTLFCFCQSVLKPTRKAKEMTRHVSATIERLEILLGCTKLLTFLIKLLVVFTSDVPIFCNSVASMAWRSFCIGSLFKESVSCNHCGNKHLLILFTCIDFCLDVLGKMRHQF